MPSVIEDIEYATRPSADSNGAYWTLYAPDGSYISRHTSSEECTEAAVEHAKASGLEGDQRYRLVPPEKHMTILLRGGSKYTEVNEPDLTPPGPPVGGYLNNFAASSVVLNWTNDPANDIDFTRVYKSTTSALTGFTLLATVDFPAQAYTDVAYNPAVQSWYKLTHVDNVGNESAFGAAFTDNTAPAAPSAPVVQSVTSSTVTLAMPAITEFDHASFSINRSSDGNSYAGVASGITAATWQDTSLNPSTTYYYRARVQDRSGNLGPSSSSVQATTSSTATSKNWNPGHYIRPGPWRGTAEYLSYLDMCVTDGYWKGIQIIAEWRNLEGSIGDYSAGMAKIQEILDYAASVGKQVGLNIWWNSFTGNNTSPAYINAGAPYGADYFRNGTSGSKNVRVWNSATWARFEAMVQAYYDAFGNHPNFEYLKVPGETALGSNPGAQPDYNLSAAVTNCLHMIDTVFTTSGRAFFSFGLNYWPSGLGAFYSQILNRMLVIGGGGVGGPDAAHTEDYPSGTDFTTDAYFALSATPTYIKTYVGVPSGTDYRGQIALVSNNEGAYTNTAINPSAAYDDLIPACRRYVTHLGWAPSNPANPIDPADTFANLRVRLANPSTALIYTAYPASFS